MYIILQICCFDCNKLINLYLCYDNNYKEFIKKLDDFVCYAYIVYNSIPNEIDRFDGSDL